MSWLVGFDGLKALYHCYKNRRTRFKEQRFSIGINKNKVQDSSQMGACLGNKNLQMHKTHKKCAMNVINQGEGTSAANIAMLS